MKTVITGVLLLDKPLALSSHDAVFKAKKAYHTPAFDSKKAGHTGTLDPMATGLLPICFGGATKFANFGLDADKGYVATIKLGQKTDTGDIEGQVIENQAVLPFDDEQLTDIANSLIGQQLQTPPLFSALKKDGKKLYEYARAGQAVTIEPRPIEIIKLSLTKLSDNEIQMSVICSKGTYVRVLGETVAERLGTVGHLTNLRRTATGGFDISQAIDLQRFLDLTLDERLALLHPADCLMPHLPSLTIDHSQCDRLKLGQRLNVYRQFTADLLALVKNEKTVIKLYNDGVFVGVGELDGTGRLQPKGML